MRLTTACILVASIAAGSGVLLVAPLSQAEAALLSSAPIATGGSEPADTILADFNEDGRPDAVVTNGVNGTVSILLGDGSGSVKPAQGSPFSVNGYLPGAVAKADFNGDGHVDLAIVNRNDAVSVLLGDGQGHLTNAPNSPFPTGAAPGSMPTAIAVGKFTGSGHTDVVVANRQAGNVSVLRGDGAGGLAPSPGSPYSTHGDYPQALVTDDFNKDGKLDVYALNACPGDGGCAEGAVSVLLGNGSGGLQIKGVPVRTNVFQPASMVIGRFGTWATQRALVVGGSPTSLALAAVMPLGPVALGLPTMLSEGVPMFLRGASTIDRLAAADLNGDGWTDLVATAPYEQSVLVYYSDGRMLHEAAGSPFHLTNAPSDWQTRPLALGDLNSDGRPDAVTASVSSSGGAPGFLSVLANLDVSPPVEHPVLTSATPRRPNGWYQGDVQLTWSVTDQDSPVTAKKHCGPASVTTNTAKEGTPFTCIAVSAGGLSAASVTIKRDATPPTVTCPSPPPTFEQGSGGTVTAKVSDANSGPLTPTVSAPANTSSTGVKSLMLTGRDVAGHRRTVSCTYVVA
jgi:hypothetical protein